jgi:hypothetical protein
MPDIDTTEITKANRYHLAILKAETVLKELNPPRPDLKPYADVLEYMWEQQEPPKQKKPPRMGWWAKVGRSIFN